MSSEDDKTSDKGSQILFEYYRKYSQNRNLSRYFSGTSVSYLPPVVSDEDKPQESSPQSQHKDLIKITIDESEIVIENPSSDDDNFSLSDHRRLEWDNGADIGYNTARKNADKLQKSFSLPALDLSVAEIKTTVAKPSTVITHSNSEENIEIAVFSSSSSHTSPQPQKNSNSSSLLSKDSPLESQIATCSSHSQTTTGKSSNSSKSIELKSSSSNSDEAVQLRDFQKTINFLKHKIGLPGAHSTPNVESQMWGQYKMVGNGAVKKVPKAVGRKNKNESSSESSKSTPKPHKSKVKTKVVELSISTPINVNCRSFSCDTPALKTDAQPKAVQTDSVNLRHTETQFDLDPPPADSHKKAICDDMADSASSFEYISVGRTSANNKGIVKEVLMTESSRTSRTSSEDVDKHLERLQLLLRSKKLNSSTKRRYIRKLLNELKDLDNSSESSDFFIPKKDSLRSQSSKSVKDDPCSCGATSTTSSNIPIKTITGTESEPVKFTAQVQELQNRLVASLPTSKHQHFELPKSISESDDSVTTKTEDYLLKFAENERAYQLSWINNEISHLSKLKTILELNKKNPNKKTSNYNVVQKGGETREYIINTDVNLESKTKINYHIDGKEYAISNSNSSSSDRVVVADIKVSSSDKHTNINIRTICSMCKQVICVCKSVSVSHTKSSSHKEEESLQSLLQLESLTPDDFNSLQRIFKGCDCTTKNPSCSCGFVRKLLDTFQGQLKKMEGVSIQTDPLEFTAGFDQKLCCNKLDFDLGSKTERRQVETENVFNNLDAQVQADKQLQPQGMQTSDRRLKRQVQTDEEPKIRLDSETQVDDPLQALGTQTFHLFEVGSKNQQTSNQGLGRKVQTDNLQNNLESQVQVDQLLDLKSQQTSNQGLERQIQTEGLRSSLQSQAQVSERNAGVQIDKNQVDGHTETVVTKDESHSQTATKGVCQCVQTEDDCLDAGTNPQPTKRAEKNVQASLETRSVQTSHTDKDGTQTTTSSNSAASRVTCFCCKQKAFLAEVSYLQEGNDSMVVCTRCYYNRPRYCLHNACGCWSYWLNRRSNDTQRNRLGQCCKKRPPGLMYTVTLPDNETTAKSHGVGRIQVQDGWSGKSLKDKENHSRKMTKEKVKKKVENVVQGPQYTLTDFLIKNKPEFIFSAEHRRQMLLNSRKLREQQTDNVKLNFLENNENRQSDQDKYKLFTGREMKEINKRNYKKLPEVQQKLVKQRQNRLRRADKLISSIFAKKVQKSILKGKGNFPIDKPLTYL